MLAAAAADTAALDVLRGYLLPYQVEWLADKSRKRIALKGRQLGFTDVGIGLDAVLEALEWPHRINIFSNRHSNAKDALADCAKWIRALELCGASVEADIGKEQIEFSSGSRIVALPATESAARGPRGSAYVDEASTLRSELAFWTAVYPTIASSPRYRVSLVSTPRGARGLFYTTWRDFEEKGARSGWSGHKVDLATAVAQGLPRDMHELISGARNPEQEYFCKFDAGGNFFQLGLVLGVDAEREARPPRGRVAFGVDLAKIHDNSAIVPVSREPGGRPHVHGAYVLESVNYKDQRHILYDLVKEWGARVVNIDATKHPAFVDEFRAMFNEHKDPPLIVGTHTTNQYKERTIGDLRSAMEEMSLTIDTARAYKWDKSSGLWLKSDEKVLLDDTLKVEQGYTPSGLVQYTSPRDDQGHGDSFSALYLGVDAVRWLDRPPSALPRPDEATRARSRDRRMRF